MQKHNLKIFAAMALMVLVVWAVVRWVNPPQAEISPANQDQSYTYNESADQASRFTPLSSNEKLIQPPNITPKNTMHHLATIKTTLGEIKIQLFDVDAPKTVQNFMTLANKKFYNGLIFHRVIKGFMIQGGDPTGTGSGGPGYKFEDELNPKTASYQAGYTKGVVAMANAGPNTNGSQFFIMHADYPLGHNYTIFGKVIEGQDVVDKIAMTPTGVQDRPITPIAMQSVTVETVNSGQ